MMVSERTRSEVRPNFFLVGAARSGTTSLWRYLSCHPDIYMSPTAKEPHFFLWAGEQVDFDFGGWKRIHKAYHTNWSAYLDLFRAATGRVVGEASVFYLPHPRTPEKIKARCPDAKIAICLRDPVARAWSWYRFNKQRQAETAPDFATALLRERENPRLFYTAQYVGLGRYAPQVERYIEHFGQERVQIILFEDLVQNPARVCLDLYRFLEVDPRTGIQAFDTHNAVVARHSALNMLHRLKEDGGMLGRVARAMDGGFSASETYRRLKMRMLNLAGQLPIAATSGADEMLCPEIRDALRQEFCPEIERLERLIGRDLTAWKTGAEGERA